MIDNLVSNGSVVVAPGKRNRLFIAAQYGVPLALCAWRFTPILRRMVDTGDFPSHIRFAQQIAASGRVTIPHFGYELSVIAGRALLPGEGWPVAAVAVSLAGILASAALLVWWTAEAVPLSRPALRFFAAALLPLVLLTVQPVLPLGPLARDPFLIGYFPANQYHNPTTLFSKPVALALWGFGISAAFGGARTALAFAGCAALVAISALIKPSFLMAFLPAVGVLAAFNWRRANWQLIALGLVTPSAILLAAQFMLRYRLQEGDGVSIVWAPLMVLGLYGPTDAVTLTARLAQSVLFPIVVFVSFFGAAVRDRSLLLGWTTLAAGVSYGYLFAEAGGKASAGDFLWSGQLAAFVLFALSAVFLLRLIVARTPPASRTSLYSRVAICIAILAWHVESGVRHLQASWYD